MAFLFSSPSLPPLPELPDEPSLSDISQTRRRAQAGAGLSSRIFTSPLGDTSQPNVKKTLLGE